MSAAMILDLLIAATRLAQNIGLDLSDLRDAINRAESAGQELSAADRQRFIDEAQNAIDQL